jgi:hypothetical protein
MTVPQFDISVGMFGAILQELLYWYNARTKLDSEESRTILRSAGYWLVVIAMAIGAGVASYLWFKPNQQAARTYLLFGAAFPVLFKKAVDAFIPNQTHLGLTKETKVEQAKKQALQNYFKAA